MNILCTLKNIHLSFGSKQIFENAQLSVTEKDRIGLLGLNGKGKSSLFNVLTENITPDHSTPNFQFDKYKGDNDIDKAFSVLLIPQEIDESSLKYFDLKNFVFNYYPELDVINIKLNKIEERLGAGETSEEIINEHSELLEEFEHLNIDKLISSYESYLKYFSIYHPDKKITDLSGGEQKKVLLSIGLSSTKNLVLWDEPTNHLDIKTIKIFEDELIQSQNAFIIISHDRYLLGKVTNKVFHIDSGTINTFSGSYTDYLEFLSAEEERRKNLLNKLKNKLGRETAWMRQGIKARGTRSKKRVENFNDLTKAVQEVKNKAKKTLELSLAHSNRKTKSLVQIKDVTFSYANEVPLFENININVSKEDRIGVLGNNGVGKSTLIKLITGDLLPTTGIIKTADDLKIKYFDQKREDLDPEKTPYELLGEGNDFIALPGGHKKHVFSYFESFLFSKDQIHRPISTFSGGEKNRIHLALNLTQDADLWIFDEPTNDLDLDSIEVLEQKLTEFKAPIILISHDRSFLSNITNKIILIKDKEITQFEAGYSQAEDYLDALDIEESLLKKPTKEVKIPKVSNESNNERLRFLDSELPKLEEYLGQIEGNIKDFDFTDVNPEKQKRYDDFLALRERLEEKLLEFYEEKEKLISK